MQLSRTFVHDSKHLIVNNVLTGWNTSVLINGPSVSVPVKSGKKVISHETARSLMALADTHQIGKLDADGFMDLLQTVRYWKVTRLTEL